MLSADSLKEISSVFCGDTAGFYTYKHNRNTFEIGLLPSAVISMVSAVVRSS